MKKLSFLLCSLVLLLGIVLLPDSSGSLEVSGATQNSAGSQVEPYSDYVETDGLGYAVNIATSQNEQSFNIGAPVIDETYLDSLTMRRTYKNQSYEQTKTGVDYATISQSLGAYFDTSIKVGLDTILLNSYTDFSFSNLLAVDYSQYESQFYGVHLFEKVIYEEALPSFSIFKDTYEDYYSNAFLLSLSELAQSARTSEDYVEFFTNFGSHVLTNIRIGGKLSAFYSVLSNEVYFSGDVKSSIESQMQTSILNMDVAGTSTRFAFDYTVGGVNYSFESNNSLTVMGGNYQYCTNLQNFYGGDLSNWKNSLTEDNAVNIGYGENGLVPIWDILPDEYSSLATEMEEQFVLYSQSIDNNINDKYLFDTEYQSEYNYWVRSNEYKITDSGRFKQPYDVVYLKDAVGRFQDTLLKDGKTKLKIYLEQNLKEKNDGYQCFFIYYGLGENDGWMGLEYEYHPGDAYRNYERVSFTIPIEVNIANLTNNYFVIRYGAHGSGEDTWYTSNLNLKIVIE